MKTMLHRDSSPESSLVLQFTVILKRGKQLLFSPYLKWTFIHGVMKVDTLFAYVILTQTDCIHL